MQDSLKKKILARPSSSTASHYVVIGIGTETFGVPAGQIQEIICLGDVVPTPALPKRFTGPIQIIGKLLSLVKLPVPFIRPPGEFEVTPRTCILVLKAHSAISSKIPHGVVVDRVERILALESNEVETINTRRKGFWSAYTLGFAKRHLPVVLIDLQQLVRSQISPNGSGSRENLETATSRLKRRAQQ
jgi:chemotaxis signal transduction protein